MEGIRERLTLNWWCLCRARDKEWFHWCRWASWCCVRSEWMKTRQEC